MKNTLYYDINYYIVTWYAILYNRNTCCINTYYIDSMEKLDKYKERIITECETHKARAYIHLNKRSSI